MVISLFSSTYFIFIVLHKWMWFASKIIANRRFSSSFAFFFFLHTRVSPWNTIIIIRLDFTANIILKKSDYFENSRLLFVIFQHCSLDSISFSLLSYHFLVNLGLFSLSLSLSHWYTPTYIKYFTFVLLCTSPIG